MRVHGSGGTRGKSVREKRWREGDIMSVFSHPQHGANPWLCQFKICAEIGGWDRVVLYLLSATVR